MGEKPLDVVVHENNRTVRILSAQIHQLEVVKGSLGRLVERIDEIINRDWHEGGSISHISMNEIRDTACLIDIAFRPLCDEISEEFDNLEKYSGELYDAVIGSKSNMNF